MTVVVGLGAAGAGDDAVGLLVARRLAAEGWPARETSDATSLLSLFDRGERIILVDAWCETTRAGTLLRVSPDALAAGDALVSTHGLSIRDVLALGIELYGEHNVRVEIVAIAIDPSDCDPGELSAPVRAGMEAAVDLIRSMLRAMS